jgi:hypothetical protein
MPEFWLLTSGMGGMFFDFIFPERWGKMMKLHSTKILNVMPDFIFRRSVIGLFEENIRF